MKRLAVMFSGGGTDFQALIDGAAAGEYDGKIVVRSEEHTSELQSPA